MIAAGELNITESRLIVGGTMAEKKKIILTGGGTAGHVTPHLALIPKLQEKGYKDYKKD